MSRISSAGKITYPVVKFFDLNSTTTSREISSMNEDITIRYVQLDVRCETVCVTHAHKTQLES